MYRLNNKCLNDCPFGMWEDDNDFTCQTCSPGCTSCFNIGTDNCYTCGTNGNIYYKYLNDTICSQTCPDGSFINTNIPYYCQPCSRTCVTCQGTA